MNCDQCGKRLRELLQSFAISGNFCSETCRHEAETSAAREAEADGGFD